MTSALVVVDMLNDFVDGVLPNPAAKEIIRPIARLAEAARAGDDWLVVYTNDAHLESDVELSVFPPHAMAGTPGAMVIDELAPKKGDLVVAKRAYSAFTDTGLDDLLRRHQVERLVFTGQHTDCCVRHAAYDAFLRRYQLAVCADATTVYEPGDSEPVPPRQHRALQYLETFYGASLVSSSNVF